MKTTKGLVITAEAELDDGLQLTIAMGEGKTPDGQKFGIALTAGGNGVVITMPQKNGKPHMATMSLHPVFAALVEALVEARDA